MGDMRRLRNLMLAVLAAAGLWGLSLLQANAGSAAPDRFAPDSFLQFASRSLKEGYQVSAQWYGHADDGQASGLKEKLVTQFTLSESSAADGFLLLADEGSSLRVGWNSLDGEHQGELFIRLEAEGMDQAALAEAGVLVDSWLKQEGMRGDWSVKAAGTWIGADGMPPKEALDGLAGTLLAGESLGVYQDGGIVNTLYRTDRIGLKAAGTEAGMQTALHRNTVTGEWNLAVGAPMLTGEF